MKEIRSRPLALCESAGSLLRRTQIRRKTTDFPNLIYRLLCQSVAKWIRVTLSAKPSFFFRFSR